MRRGSFRHRGAMKVARLDKFDTGLANESAGVISMGLDREHEARSATRRHTPSRRPPCSLPGRAGAVGAPAAVRPAPDAADRL
ncbi:hypothetical protein GCM10027168_19660 [Streptomyces capparidis]